MNINWKQPAIDGAIAVAGGALLDKYVVQNISFIGDLINKLPADMAGISVKAVLLGAVALIAAKMVMK